MADCEKYLYRNPPHVSKQKRPKDVSYWLENKGKHFLLFITSYDWFKRQYYKSVIWHSWEIVTVTQECHMALLGVKGLSCVK